MPRALSKSEIIDKICDAAAEASGRERHKVGADTVLNMGWGSLGIDGGDAVDLIDDISRRIGWEPTSLPFERYFGPEVGWEPISALIRHFKRRRNEKSISLTVKGLAEYYERSKPST